MANYTAVEKYIRRLEKRLEEISPKGEAILRKHINIDKKISEKSLEGLEELIAAIPELRSDVLEAFSDDELSLYDEGGALMSLIFKLKEENDFTSYAELENSFIRYNVPKDIQIKIIFELLKRKEKSYLEYCDTLLELRRLLPYPDKLEQKLKRITNGMAGTTALDREEYINLLMPLIKEPELESTVEKYKKAYRTINEFHNNGKVVAHSAPIAFKIAIKAILGNLTDKQIELIMDESRRLYIAELESQENEYILNQKRKERALEHQENIALAESNNKNRRLALQKLKMYLKEDLPIRFITEEEIKEVEELLLTACYNQTDIDRIKRNILANNKTILEQERVSKLENAANMYLTDIDKELLNIAKTMLSVAEDENPILKKVKEDLMFIEAELLKLTSEESEDKTDALELINLWLDELRDHLVEYRSSNYKLCMIKPE